MKSKMKVWTNKRAKGALALALAAATALGAASCANKQAASSQPTASVDTKLTGPVTIDFWHAMTGAQATELKQLASDFMAQNKDVTVNLVAQGGYTDLQQKLMAAAKAKQSPAMAMAYESWETNFIKNNLITDLTPYKDNKTVGLSASSFNDFVKVFRDSNTFDGKLYSLPFNKSTEILFYNEDYFKQFGLSAPKTWDELASDAQKLTTTINGKKVIGVGFENSLGMVDFPSFLLQAGGTLVDDKAGKAKFNSAEGKTALNYLYDLFKNGQARMANEDQYISNVFTRGDVAMAFGSCAGMSFIASGAKGKFSWNTAVLPKGKQAAVPFMGTNLVVFSSVTSQQKLAAWEFIKFLTDKDQTIQWAEKTGYVPVRTSALNDSEWKNFTTQNPTYKPAEDQFGAGYFLTRIAGSDEANNKLTTDIQTVLLGKATVDDGLKTAAANYQKSLDDAKS